ncbi:hypothetical protein CHUAL_011863 [Chamberlinius hualienensis]
MLGLRLGLRKAEDPSKFLGDHEIHWRFRQPPWGSGIDGYHLCHRVLTAVPCRLGEQCSGAHSQEELDEWRLRADLRQKEFQEHSSEKSYLSNLMLQISQVDNVNELLKEEVNYAQLRIFENPKVVVCRDNPQHWIINITSKVALHWIALLDNSSRSEFALDSVTSWCVGTQNDHVVSAQCQEWRNPDLTKQLSFRELSYTIGISFVSSVFGTFEQTVVFDFGFQPYLFQRLSAEVVPDPSATEVVDREEVLVCRDVRWDSQIVHIVSFKPSPLMFSMEDERLLNRYLPASGPVSLRTDILSQPMHSDTYKPRLHTLLQAEEWAQKELLAKYNIETELILVNSYWLTGPTSGAKFSVQGELFAQLQLHRRLTEDTAAGRIILSGCNFVLLSPCNDSPHFRGKKKVYEAFIECKCKEEVYLRLSSACVSELNLQPSTVLKAEIQFQLDRLPICELHHALDMLAHTSVVFPRLDECPSVSRITQKQIEDTLDRRMNAKQKEAIAFMIAPSNVYLPPILLMGPYGTGKTFTLSQVIKNLLIHTNARILVCTHSNSAADLYVKDYLHPYLESGIEAARPLRIYYQHRRVETVHPTVLKYCLFHSDGNARMFRKPTLQDVLESRVVIVTLSTSRCLSEIGLPSGYFTHVLIDEAAQVMECEAIVPFSLVTTSTRVILAGDHMQLSPEVHSPLARQHGLHVSLLERLFDSYPKNYPCAILLCENYRSHPMIVNLTSTLFYDNQLTATSIAPAHSSISPLSFYTAKGHEKQDSNSTAYYNSAEVYEVVERVIELKETWPSLWGPLDDTSIGIVTPYADQVFHLRGALRQKKLGHISVERVLNIQGKQFRAIIISTVRTRHTCSGKEDKFYKFKGGDRQNINEEEEDEQDFGFLSNAKLLITAITRAQAIVEVVGDPIALCSIGKCRKLWEHYLETCHNSSSIHGTTYHKIRVELENLEVGISSSLDPKAPVFIPRNISPVNPQLYSMRPAHPMLSYPRIVPYVSPNSIQFKMGGGTPSNHIPPSPSQLMTQNSSNTPVRTYNSIADMSRLRVLFENHQVNHQMNGMRMAPAPPPPPPPQPRPNGSLMPNFGERKLMEMENSERRFEELMRLRHMNGFSHPVSYIDGNNHRVSLEEEEKAVALRRLIVNQQSAEYNMLLQQQGSSAVDLRMPAIRPDDLESRIRNSLHLNDFSHNFGGANNEVLAASAFASRLLTPNDMLNQRVMHPSMLRPITNEDLMDNPISTVDRRLNVSGRAVSPPSSASQCSLSYAEAVRTAMPPSGSAPISVVADFEQRVAPRTNNGLYRYF